MGLPELNAVQLLHMLRVRDPGITFQAESLFMQKVSGVIFWISSHFKLYPKKKSVGIQVQKNSTTLSHRIRKVWYLQWNFGGMGALINKFRYFTNLWWIWHEITQPENTQASRFSWLCSKTLFRNCLVHTWNLKLTMKYSGILSVI